ncbi:MAG: glycosyltransferase [Opitutaceae bacterium]|nr:glycosyltransferase [Opitutaceae bacterium]
MAAARGCVVVDVAKRSIAAARNGAAWAARGETLCFIDADSIIHPETFNEIERVMKTGRCVVGATGVRMERLSPGIWLTWLALVPMTRILGMDSGVVFCRRDDFEKIGGYREEILAAEDVDFLFRLKRLGRGRDQRFVRASAAKATTSTRKFDRHGDWHYFTIIHSLPFQLLFRRQSLRQVIWNYWYEARKG